MLNSVVFFIIATQFKSGIVNTKSAVGIHKISKVKSNKETA